MNPGSCGGNSTRSIIARNGSRSLRPFYKHPLEMVVNSLIGSVLVYLLLVGLSPEADAVYTLCAALGEFFFHTNIRTPRWVGFVFQRPEMHRIHHQDRRHRNNYGDITWWDMMFSTYENPRHFQKTCGLAEIQERRLLDMLCSKTCFSAMMRSDDQPIRKSCTADTSCPRRLACRRQSIAYGWR